MFRDPDVPMFAKAVLPLLVAYVAMPFDLVPDFIPVLGQLDDLVIVAGGMTLFLALTPRRVIEYHLGELE
jgi:carbonic anhydrase